MYLWEKPGFNVVFQEPFPLLVLISLFPLTQYFVAKEKEMSDSTQG